MKFSQTGESEKTRAGYWKFNNSLLSDLSYVMSMRNEIQNIQKDVIWVSEGLRVRWDFLKCKIKQFTMNFSTEQSRQGKKSEPILNLRICQTNYLQEALRRKSQE